MISFSIEPTSKEAEQNIRDAFAKMVGHCVDKGWTLHFRVGGNNAQLVDKTQNGPKVNKCARCEVSRVPGIATQKQG